MSILSMQRMAPIATESAVAVLSTTSSGSDCCKPANNRSPIGRA